MTVLLRLKDLTVSRGESVLISGFDLTVSAGDLIWLSGANGIGKTTLLRTMAGLLRPDIGQIEHLQKANERGLVGFQSHKDALKPTLTVRENIRFWATLSGNVARIEAAIDRLGLESFADRAASTLSAGQSRRVALAQLWAQDKRVWILDEPAAAIDNDGTTLIDSLITERLASGGAVILASHAAPRALAPQARQITLSASEAI